jgi:hypothetical protein
VIHCARDDGRETSKLPGKSFCRRGTDYPFSETGCRGSAMLARHGASSPSHFAARTVRERRVHRSSRMDCVASRSTRARTSLSDPARIRDPSDRIIHGPSSMPRANTPAPPIPQLIPTRRLAGSSSRPPGQTPGAPAPDSPSSQTPPVEETREPPQNPTLGTPLHKTVHASTSLLHTGTLSTPPPQFTPARPLASSPSGLPGRTPRVPAKRDVPSAAPPAPSPAVPQGAPRERPVAAASPFPVTLTEPQSRETRHTHALALNPQTPGALPRPNLTAQPVPLPRPASLAASRRNETRISIGRIDVQVNNQLGHPSVAPNAVRSAPPQAINLERLFLTRFSMRP